MKTVALTVSGDVAKSWAIPPGWARPRRIGPRFWRNEGICAAARGRGVDGGRRDGRVQASSGDDPRSLARGAPRNDRAVRRAVLSARLEDARTRSQAGGIPTSLRARSG